jgi:fucose 4-O-acetylase-like acetyltransferase
MLHSKIVEQTGSETHPQGNPSLGRRLLFIDNIRWFLIVLVVLQHLAVTYGAAGSWYYNENKAPGRHQDLASQLLLTIFCSANQAYFMGLLFFIAGYFVPGAYDQKGAGRFLRDRCIRLGVPTLFFMLALHPATLVIMKAFNRAKPLEVLAGYPNYLASLRFIRSSGPLWFALALLLFSIAYAGARVVMANGKASPLAQPRPLTHRRLLALVALMFLATFLIRLVQPIGTSVCNMQLCFFPQYIIMFILGLKAWRLDLLGKIPYALGLSWFKAALLMGSAFWGVVIATGTGDWRPYFGGLRWQAAAYAFYESFFCVGVSLGVIVLFREIFKNQGPLSATLSRNAFGVYVLHAPVLVLGTMACRNVMINPLLKCMLMSLILVPACFAISLMMRKIPFFGRLLA